MSQFVKYPRTPHLPWSPADSRDDLRLESYDWPGPLVVTEKMDGENTTMYRDGIHARSLNYRDHESRHLVKGLWGMIRHQIPDTFRICGENLYAKHSIEYDDLESYFQVFSVWSGDRCLSWGDTVQWCTELGLVTVPVLARGVQLSEVEGLRCELAREGYVVRPENAFLIGQFSSAVAKWVRKDRVSCSDHWLSQQVVPNRLMIRR